MEEDIDCRIFNKVHRFLKKTHNFRVKRQKHKHIYAHSPRSKSIWEAPRARPDAVEYVQHVCESNRESQEAGAFLCPWSVRRSRPHARDVLLAQKCVLHSCLIRSRYMKQQGLSISAQRRKEMGPETDWVTAS